MYDAGLQILKKAILYRKAVELDFEQHNGREEQYFEEKKKLSADFGR